MGLDNGEELKREKKKRKKGKGVFRIVRARLKSNINNKKLY